MGFKKETLFCRQEGGRRVAEKSENHAFRISPSNTRQDGGVRGIR